MSREEAATFYLDGLLGFRGAYDTFREASETLCEKDRIMIERAVAGGINSVNRHDKESLFGD